MVRTGLRRYRIDMPFDFLIRSAKCLLLIVEHRLRHIVLPRRRFFLPSGAVSDREASQSVEQLAVDRLVVLDSLGEGNVHYFVVLDAYHHISLVFH